MKTEFTHEDRVRFRRMAVEAVYDADATGREDIARWIESGAGLVYARLPGLSVEQWKQLDRVARALATASHADRHPAPAEAPLSEPQLIAAFQGELEQLCKRFRVFFSHEDSQGAGLLSRVETEDEAGVDIYIIAR